MARNVWNNNITILKTILRWIASDFSWGNGNSRAIMKSPVIMVSIWMMGTLTIRVMKTAELGEGLCRMEWESCNWWRGNLRTEGLQDHAGFHQQSPKRIYGRTIQRKRTIQHLTIYVNKLEKIQGRGIYPQTLAVMEMRREYSCQTRFPISFAEVESKVDWILRAKKWMWSLLRDNDREITRTVKEGLLQWAGGRHQKREGAVKEHSSTRRDVEGGR